MPRSCAVGSLKNNAGQLLARSLAETLYGFVQKKKEETLYGQMDGSTVSWDDQIRSRRITASARAPLTRGTAPPAGPPALPWSTAAVRSHDTVGDSRLHVPIRPALFIGRRRCPCQRAPVTPAYRVSPD